MKIGSYIKKFLYILVINLLLYIFLYIQFIYPIKKEYNLYNYIHPYSVKTSIIDLDDNIKNQFVDFKLINNNFISFDDEIKIETSVNNRHFRSIGTITLVGKYENDTQLKNFFNSIEWLELETNIENILDNRLKSFYYSNETQVHFSRRSEGTIELTFITKLPYNKNEVKTNGDTFYHYFLETNKPIVDTAKIEMRKYYIITIVIFIIVNTICICIIYFFNQMKKQSQ